MSWLRFFPRALRQRIVLGQLDKALRAAGVPARSAEEFMKGWKTWAGGIALIGAGLAMAAKEVATGSFNVDEILKGVALVGSGFSAIGLGHKVDKNTAAVEEAAPKSGGPSSL